MKVKILGPLQFIKSLQKYCQRFSRAFLEFAKRLSLNNDILIKLQILCEFGFWNYYYHNWCNILFDFKHAASLCKYHSEDSRNYSSNSWNNINNIGSSKIEFFIVSF